MMANKARIPTTKDRNIVIDKTKSARISNAIKAIATRTHHTGMNGKDEAKLKKLLYAKDVNIIVDSSWSKQRTCLANLVINPNFENLMGTIILAQFCFAIMEVDFAAGNEDIPPWLRITMFTMLGGFLLELSMRFYVLREAFFDSRTNMLDAVVVGIDLVLQLVEVFAGNIPSIAVFRIFRLTRLLRALRVLTTFRELYIMVHSFIGSMKAIFWATIMIFVVLTLWSMIAVEFLHPLNEKLAESGVHEKCERCSRAYSTVMHANLTLFQQCVAADSWGQITIPMIEHYPWTLLIYVPAFITIGMGMVNLILTVIVDRADCAKKDNEEEKLALKLAAVKLIFSQFDEDASGDVSLDEFMGGLQDSPEMHHALNLLGVRVEDLSTVFHMMDYDNSGTVSCDEFVENLAKMKSEESFMILLYVKHFMSSMEKQIDDHVDMLREEVIKAQKHAQAAGMDANVGIPVDSEGGGAKGVAERVSVAPSAGFTALKQDVEALCRSTEAQLADMSESITKKLDEHFAEHRRSLDTFNNIKPLQCVPERAHNRSGPWAIMCGEVSSANKAPLATSGIYPTYSGNGHMGQLQQIRGQSPESPTGKFGISP